MSVRLVERNRHNLIDGNRWNVNLFCKPSTLSVLFISDCSCIQIKKMRLLNQTVKKNEPITQRRTSAFFDSSGFRRYKSAKGIEENGSWRIRKAHCRGRQSCPLRMSEAHREHFGNGIIDDDRLNLKK